MKVQPAAFLRTTLPLGIDMLDTLDSGRYQVMVRLHGDTLQRELPLLVEVAPPPEQATLVTRGQEPPEDDFERPLVGLVTSAPCQTTVCPFLYA